jgi:hypothetical protein
MTAKEGKKQETKGDGFGWNDAIDPTQQEHVLLPEGKALFAVTKLERARGEFSDCGTVNIAKMKLEVSTLTEGFDSVEVPVQLPLVGKMKWKLVQFFTAIGQRKHGDEGEFVPNWAKVEGATGSCLVGHRELKRKDGSGTYKVNDIKEFSAPEEAGADDNLKF